jgi:hypothetical protein
MARSQIAADPEYATTFSRFGHEIDQEFVRNRVPVQNRTPEAYKMVADMVRGRHWKELAREEAQRLAATHAPGTARSSPDSGFSPETPQGDALDQAWDSDHPYFKAVRTQGLNKRDIREAAQRQGLAIDKFVNLVQGSNTIIAPDGKHVQMRREVTNA